MESLLFCTLSNKRLTQMERLDQVFVLVSAGAGEKPAPQRAAIIQALSRPK